MLILKHGLSGYMLFFSIILISKFINYLIFGGPNFRVEIEDILLALMGFFYAIFVKSVERFSKSGIDINKK